MKYLVVFILFVISAVFAEKPHCKLPDAQVPTGWKTLTAQCTKSLKDQINVELGAAMTYLAMGSNFLQDSKNRPGFAKFFLESASEERQHAIKILEYLLMRGQLTADEDFLKLIDDPKPGNVTWETGVGALMEALELETDVTNKIKQIISSCEEAKVNKVTVNDYHVSDWLTGDFLEEQYQGQRKLAGMVSTLSKMMKVHGDLGEFLYDKTLL